MSINELRAALDPLIGLQRSAQSLTLLQVSVRAALMYLIGYALLRIGEHRFVGKNTAFDVVLGFIFGATLSRAVNGSAPFFDTIVAGVILLGMHWLFTTLAFRSDWINVFLNGKAIPIIKDGQIQREHMRQKRINDRLLVENLRLNGHCADPEHAQAAYYERSGVISVIPKDDSSPPEAHADRRVRVVEVNVEEGVQTVRIEVQGPTLQPPASQVRDT